MDVYTTGHLFGYVKCRDFGTAKILSDEMPKRNMVHVSLLLRFLFRMGL